MRLAFIFLVAIVLVNAIPSGNLTIEHKHGPKLEWWQNGVFYQIYPRSFKDSNGDGVGDLQGVIQKLDYLKELGIDGAWLSPIFASPQADFGYDISNFYEIDPVFGRMQDIEELFQKANKSGIKIILDFVPNHSSDECEWFKKSVKRIEPYTNYYVWHDGKVSATGERSPPNNWNSVFYGSAWTWNDERQQFYLHQFAKQQPDLNYRNPAVVEEMKNVLRFWLKKGAGGFRIDAVCHLFEVEDLRDEPLSGYTNDSKSYSYTHHHYTIDLDEMYDMVYEWRALVDDFHKSHGGEKPILMTEAYANSSEYRKYFHSADKKRPGSQMPFNFVLITDLNKESTADDFKRVIDDRIAIVPAGVRLNWVLGNHDQPRVGSRFGEARIDSLLTLVMTLPGIAVTYNGEEIGMLDYRDGISYQETLDPAACNIKEDSYWKELSRDPERTPFQWDSSKWAGFSEGNIKPWLPVHRNYVELNLALQSKFKRSTFKLYKQLVKLRKNQSFIYGSYKSKVVNDNVLAYVRALSGHETYVILINFGIREETINVNELANDFGANSEIVVAGSDTFYSTKDIIPTNNVLLRKYNVIIIKSSIESSATSTVASLTIILGAAFVRFMF